MSQSLPALTFGPVPSRRLGRSLGINHIPPKTCTYACVYCQLGQTHQMQIQRQSFYAPDLILSAVKEKIAEAHKHSETIDYLTLVPDGEPTLDEHLTELLLALKPLGIPLAIITNASLLTEHAVQSALMHADWVSLKVDAVDEGAWHKIDRPHRHLRLSDILNGARHFAQNFTGHLVTETMLIAGLNDTPAILQTAATFITALNPAVAYLGIPTRPPAESWVQPPDEATLNHAYQIFANSLPQVELLIGYEGNAFAATGDVASDLLSITAVHPMRHDAVVAFLARTDTSWEVVQELIAQERLLISTYHNQTFYLRNLAKKKN